MRARLILNPKSGTDRATVTLPLINERLRTIADHLDITMTVDADDAARAAARALADGCDALYVAGGDGTLNSVLRGLVTVGDSEAVLASSRAAAALPASTSAGATSPSVGAGPAGDVAAASSGSLAWEATESKADGSGAGGEPTVATDPPAVALPRRMPIGIIPMGTGNDFARALGLGDGPEAALDALVQRRVVDVDIGLLNGSPFVNMSAGGFIADVSQAVTEGLKDAAGKLAYLIGGARALLGSEPFSARIVIHDVHPLPEMWSATLDVQLFAVCNARFIGGGYAIAPDALIDDGLLDVLVVRRLPMLDFMGVLQRIAAGDVSNHPDVLHFKSSSFDLEFSRTVRVNTDGEVLAADTCRYRVLPKGASFFCGATPDAASTAGQ